MRLHNIRDFPLKYTSLLVVNRTSPDLSKSGGDNLAATFSPELADLTLYVIDVAEGEKIPRKGGPGITRSDRLVINKIDLTTLVGANLGVIEADTVRMRVGRPFVFSDLKSGSGVEEIALFIIEQGGLATSAAPDAWPQTL